jgi:hypothetical protein
MGQKRNILIIGSKEFGTATATLFELRDGFSTICAASISIQLFLTKWRPDCAIVDFDPLHPATIAKIDSLTRFELKLPVVLITSHPVPYSLASSLAAVLRPSEVHAQLVPFVKSLFAPESANLT